MTNFDKLIKEFNKITVQVKWTEFLQSKKELINKRYDSNDIKFDGRYLIAPNGQSVLIHRKNYKFYTLYTYGYFEKIDYLKEHFAKYVNDNFSFYPTDLNKYYTDFKY